MTVDIPVEVLHENCINCSELVIESVSIEASSISGMKAIIHNHNRCANLSTCQRLMENLKNISSDKHAE